MVGLFIITSIFMGEIRPSRLTPTAVGSYLKWTRIIMITAHKAIKHIQKNPIKRKSLFVTLEFAPENLIVVGRSGPRLQGIDEITDLRIRKSRAWLVNDEINAQAKIFVNPRNGISNDLMLR
jgi:hypothetical protein